MYICVFVCLYIFMCACIYVCMNESNCLRFFYLFIYLFIFQTRKRKRKRKEKVRYISDVFFFTFFNNLKIYILLLRSKN